MVSASGTNIITANREAINTDTFGETVQVWRGIQTDMQPGMPEHLRQQDADRAFAVGSGHMNAGQGILKLWQACL